MKICVISDTHVRSIDELPSAILNILTEVDLIVHAGDITEKAALDGLRAMGEVKAVCGNMDSNEVKKLLPQKDVFEVAGKHIGLTHGAGAPWGIVGRVRNMFNDVDIVIFGHSHAIYNEHLKGALMLNPGRARDSYALLTISETVKAEIVKI